MAKLKLATDLSLPLSVVTEKLAFLGRTGSGKSYAAMKLAELMLAAGAQIGVIDPVGVWRSLRVPAEKGGQSFDVVVFGGLYGDVPLEPTAGELIADLICDRGISFVLDISQFIPSEQQRFVAAFAGRFFHRKKSAPSAVHLFIEECQEVIPENPSGLEAITLGVMQRLWKLGRNFGIGGSLISQRPQEIAKKALNMSGTLFAFQMTGPQERKAIKAWVADHGVAVDIESVLQKLSVGQPHVESPTFLQVSKTVQILPRVTADLSSTPTVGAATAARRPLTPIDVDRIREAMAETIEKAKADDPKSLRAALAAKDKRISELERAASASSISHEGKKVEVLTDADRELLRQLIAGLNEDRLLVQNYSQTRAREIAQEIGAILEHASTVHRAMLDAHAKKIEDRLEKKRFVAILTKLEQVSVPPAKLYRATGPTVPFVINHNEPKKSVTALLPSKPVREHNGNTSAALDLPPGERAVLTAAAQWPDRGVSRDQLGVLTGYKRSTRDAYIVRMTAKGLIAVAYGGAIVATPEGVAALGPDFEPLPTGDALYQWWRQRLPEGEARVLEVLMANHGKPVDRETIDELTGFKRSTRDAYLNRLTARRLVESVGRGQVQPSAELFS